MNLEKYLDMFLEKGSDLAIVIDPKTVVAAPWVVYKCKFGCPDYDTNHCCPPNTPTYKETQEILDCYSRGILFRTHRIEEITPLAVDMVREIFLGGYYKALGFGAGECLRCKPHCNRQHCISPEKTLPSMEACGIDVFQTVRNNGLEIRVVREWDEPQNYFGLVLVD